MLFGVVLQSLAVLMLKWMYFSLNLCCSSAVEFLHYVVAARCLRKVFISIKGIYYQVEVQGQTITWISPHQFCQKVGKRMCWGRVCDVGVGVVYCGGTDLVCVYIVCKG